MLYIISSNLFLLLSMTFEETKEYLHDEPPKKWQNPEELKDTFIWLMNKKEDPFNKNNDTQNKVKEAQKKV